MLTTLTAAVALACVTDAVDDPPDSNTDPEYKYCYPEFDKSLMALGTQVFPLMEGTFDAAKIAQVDLLSLSTPAYLSACLHQRLGRGPAGARLLNDIPAIATDVK